MSDLANAARVDAVESAPPAVPHWHRLLPWVGLALAVVLWWIGAQLLILRTPIAESFAPWPALQARARKMPESDFRSLAETRQLHVQPLFDRLLSFTTAAGGELLFFSFQTCAR